MTTLTMTNSHYSTAYTMPRSIMGQIRIAAANRLPAFIGALLGALVPSATFLVGHYELEGNWSQPKALIVLGGLLFSAATVYRWGRLAFASPFKALGFVLLAEGVMTFSSLTPLCIVALAYLILINAIATGCTIAMGATEDQPVTAASVAEDITVKVTSTLASVETRLTALESPLFAPRPTKRVRKRAGRKPAPRQLAIAPELTVLPAADLLAAACA